VADAGPLRLSGKRIGLTAVVLAVLLPALLPTLEPFPLFDFGVGSGRGKGNNSISISNPIVSLRGELSLPGNAEVLSYTTSDNLPRYLRTYALDIFDGQQWTMAGPSGLPEDRISRGPLPPPPGQGREVPATSVTTRITVSRALRNLEFLPLPYPPSRVEIEGDWRPDRDTLMVFSTENTAEGTTYTVVSDEPRPTAERLRSAASPPQQIIDRYLQLPRNLPREVRDLAVRETGGERNHYEQAIRLQEFFTSKGGFVYTLAAQGHDGQALTDFLIRNKAGYCEQFAASMAVLARVLGIPARVAVGYTGGSRSGDRWQVRTHDSHAWPELYFEGTGWLRFEPTPAGLTGQGSATV
ncbi:transglutaminaseTgpA domain-containing protein, partial [Streptosporangium algeriense]